MKQFSYKRAVQNLKFYDVPPRLHQVHTLGVQTVGGSKNAEKGRRDKYFIKKKEGQNGMPAPVHIFFPEGGGEPKILDFGSF
ncbi:MAG: hypothetical protein HY042_03220 [Spirochaetia bacterium]|nr:hypothetical protein [Spirochaetia bacterium]